MVKQEKVETQSKSQDQTSTSLPSDFVPPPGEDTGPEEFIEAPAPHEETIPAQTVQTLADIMVYTVVILHKKAAEVTAYQGFETTQEEADMWRLILTELVPHLPLKYAVLIVTAVALAVSEGSKVVSYYRYQQVLAAQVRGPTDVGHP